MNIISRDKARDLGLKRFFSGVECKHGHVSERRVSDGNCITCCVNRTRKLRKENPEIAKMYRDRHKDAAKERAKKYQEENKDRISERKRKHYKENKERISEQHREYRDRNKDFVKAMGENYRKKNILHIMEYNKKYAIENKERIRAKNRKYNKENREDVNRRNREYRKNNPMSQFLRCCLRRMFTNWKGGRKKQESIHGYKLTDLIKHIESQFVDGMSWENRGAWHVDHIKPISLFIKEGITDPSVVNALSNLRPLWAIDNLSKGSKYETQKSLN